ncbi:hypothetical protein ID866_7686, partial [Astraeus odoratus]
MPQSLRFQDTRSRCISAGLLIQRRPKSATASAAQPDQLGFIPDPTPSPASSDIPIASADDSKVSVLWSPQNWSRLFHRTSNQPMSMHPRRDWRSSVRSTPIFYAEGLRDDAGPATSAEHHSSFYPWSWLREHTYDPPHQQQLVNERVLWGSKIAKSPPTVTFDEVIDDSDAGLYKWLRAIDHFGFCFVSGVPPTPEATEKLCGRIGFIRETQYGKFWEFTADLSKGDTAYTTMALGAHTDNTCFTDPCGLQLFHLLSHTDGSGGASLLVDGFYVASLLKELHPD